MKAIIFSLLHILPLTLMAQLPVPVKFKESRSLNNAVFNIIKNAGLDKQYDTGEDGLEHISFALITLSGKRPEIAGYQEENFIYPASVYKMYVAMEILKQVSEGKYSLYQSYIVKSPNDVDRSKEISWDPRPLLHNGDTVTIKYLLDLMITRSDNSAANCLIDIAGRPAITATLHQYGWYGSEVTRKFLKRSVEDPGYDTVKSTETCAKHAAEFMYKLFTNSLVNSWVSQQMKVLLGAQLDTTKLSQGLPRGAMFYHKTGWWGPYTNDVGIIEDGKIKYILAVFLPIKEEIARPLMKKLSEDIYALMRNRH